MIDSFNVPEQKYLGKVSKEDVETQYIKWREQGYGVLLDRDGAICIDNEDSEDDGLTYAEQVEDLKRFHS